MKTARERAREVLAVTDDGDLTTDAALDKITLVFKEYARDQRHMIAEAVSGAVPVPSSPHGGLTPSDWRRSAHAVAMNTPFPGEERQ